MKVNISGSGAGLTLPQVSMSSAVSLRGSKIVHRPIPGMREGEEQWGVFPGEGPGLSTLTEDLREGPGPSCCEVKC